MIATYVSAALVCAASMLVGRALLALAGRREWSWLEPAIGFAAIISVTGLLARAPGHATSAALGTVLLLAAAAAVVWRRPGIAPGAVRAGLPVAIVVALALAIPFAVSGRWGLIGVGFNNDLGLHLAWAEWLRSGFGPTPEAGYPLGPHALATTVAAVPGIGLGQAFLGEIVAIGVLTGLTALAALGGLSAGRRTLAAALVALTYLAASYFAQAAFKETAEALFVLGFAAFLIAAPPLPRGARDRLLYALGPLALMGGIFFSYSFAGLAWPVAILALWSLTLPAVRRALRPRSLLRLLLRPVSIVALLLIAGLAVVATLVGPFGFGSTFSQVAGSDTYGPVSPVETLGVWWTSNYRLDAVGSAVLPGVSGAIGILAILVGVAWWVQRREVTIPIALGASALLYLVSLPFSGYYSQAKALMIAAPLAMLVAVKPLVWEFPRLRRQRRESAAGESRFEESPAGESRFGTDAAAGAAGVAPRGRATGPLTRLGWASLAIVFIGGAVYSSLLVLRDAPVAPAGHGAELRAFLPKLHGQPVLYAGQDRFAAYELLGADTHVPLVEFPDEAVDPNPEKPFDTGNAYSPIDFDSFTHRTLERFPFVVTGRADWNSAAPPNFKRVAETPSYVLWERTGPGPDDRHVLLEGTEAASFANCASPEIEALFAEGGTATLFADAAIGNKASWQPGSTLGPGDSATQTLELEPGEWNLSLQYFSPLPLTLSAPGFEQRLEPALDGQRPNTISLANNGQYWPAGKLEAEGGEVSFTISVAEPNWLQSLTGYDGKASVGGLVATMAEPSRTVPLAQACERWVDSYEGGGAP